MTIRDGKYYGGGDEYLLRIQYMLGLYKALIYIITFNWSLFQCQFYLILL